MRIVFLKLNRQKNLLERSITDSFLVGSSQSNNKKTGNRCGHNKHNPVLTAINHQVPPNLPNILKDAISNVKDFYYEPEKLDALRYGRRSSVTNKTTDRNIRSERRESICRILELILSKMDLVSCRIGIPAYNKNAFVLLDSYYMSYATGMNYTRANRALNDLKDAGFIKVVERCEAKANDLFLQFKSRTAIRVVQTKLFKALGISEKRIKKEREKAYRRQEKKFEQLGINKGRGLNNYITKTSNNGRRTQRVRQYLNKKTDGDMREHILKRQHYLRCYDPEIEKLPKDKQLEAINTIIIEELSRS